MFYARVYFIKIYKNLRLCNHNICFFRQKPGRATPNFPEPQSMVSLPQDDDWCRLFGVGVSYGRSCRPRRSHSLTPSPRIMTLSNFFCSFFLPLFDSTNRERERESSERKKKGSTEMVPRLREFRLLAPSCRGRDFTQPSAHLLAQLCKFGRSLSHLLDSSSIRF